MTTKEKTFEIVGSTLFLLSLFGTAWFCLVVF